MGPKRPWPMGVTRSMPTPRQKKTISVQASGFGSAPHDAIDPGHRFDRSKHVDASGGSDRLGLWRFDLEERLRISSHKNLPTGWAHTQAFPMAAPGYTTPERYLNLRSRTIAIRSPRAGAPLPPPPQRSPPRAPRSPSTPAATGQGKGQGKGKGLPSTATMATQTATVTTTTPPTRTTPTQHETPPRRPYAPGMRPRLLLAIEDEDEDEDEEQDRGILRSRRPRSPQSPRRYQPQGEQPPLEDQPLVRRSSLALLMLGVAVLLLVALPSPTWLLLRTAWHRVRGARQMKGTRPSAEQWPPIDKPRPRPPPIDGSLARDLAATPSPSPEQHQPQPEPEPEPEPARRHKGVAEAAAVSEECRVLLDSIGPVAPALDGVTAALQGLARAVDRRGAAAAGAGAGAGPAGGEVGAKCAEPEPAPAAAASDGGCGRAAGAVHECADLIYGFFELAKRKTRTEETGTVWSNATYAVEAVQGKAMGALAVTEEAMRRRAGTEAQSGGDADGDQRGEEGGGESAKK